MLKAALLFAALAPVASAQDAMELLKRVAATYKDISKTSYEFELVHTTHIQGAVHQPLETRRRVMGASARSREDTLPNGPVFIRDGQFRWTYNPQHNEYTKINDLPIAFTPSGLAEFTLVAYNAKSARLLRQEAVDLASGPVMCQVVEVERSDPGPAQYSPRTYWIDARRNTVLKMTYKITTGPERTTPSETTITVAVRKANLGEPVDESLLRFTPPPDSVQVDALTFGPKSLLVGAETPDFALKAADGRTITSSNLRGSVVLLHFNAVWNDDSRLLLELAHRSLQSHGLTTLYVVSAPYMPSANSKEFTSTLAFDTNGAVAKKFGVTYKGTFLLDRSGKVIFGDPASSNLTGLTKALQQAGVW